MFGNKVYCFYHIWNLIRICSVFLRKSTARWSKLHSTSTDDPAEKEEQISWITQNILHFFEKSSVKLTEIGENFMHGCQNCILHVRWNISRKTWCWGKKFTVLSLLNFSQIMFGVLQKNFGTVVKTAFHVNGWSFQERTNLSNKTESLNFFGNSSVKFTEFGESFKHGCQNCILHVRRNNSREIWCWGKKVTVFITFVF